MVTVAHVQRGIWEENCEAVIRGCNFNPCGDNSICVENPEGLNLYSQALLICWGFLYKYFEAKFVYEAFHNWLLKWKPS